MKVFFDTNVYVAEAIAGGAAGAMVEATLRARWRVYVSEYVLDETVRVMTKRLGCRVRFANDTKQRCLRRSHLANEPQSRHQVPTDSGVTPILRAALDAGVDLLVTNDTDLLSLTPYEGLKIISMTAYFELLENEGLL